MLLQRIGDTELSNNRLAIPHILCQFHHKSPHRLHYLSQPLSFPVKSINQKEPCDRRRRRRHFRRFAYRKSQEFQMLNMTHDSNDDVFVPSSSSSSLLSSCFKIDDAQLIMR